MLPCRAGAQTASLVSGYIRQAQQREFGNGQVSTGSPVALYTLIRPRPIVEHENPPRLIGRQDLRRHVLVRALSLPTEGAYKRSVMVVDAHRGDARVDDVDALVGSPDAGDPAEHIGVLADLDPDRRLLDQRRRPTPHRPRLVDDGRDVALGGDGADPGAVGSGCGLLGAAGERSKGNDDGHGDDNDRAKVYAPEPTATL